MTAYAKDELLAMYEHLARGRIFVARMNQAVNEGLIRTSFHSAYGQEAVDVGMLCAMKKTDWYVPNHRSQAGIIMRMDPYGFMAEVFGKRDGLFKGVAYDYHMADVSGDVRIIPNSAVLGGQAPTATGFAFALKHMKRGDEVVVATYGDGAASEGPTSEAYNLASLFKVPIVFVIINNEWAMTVPLERQTTNPNISERAIPYGLSTQIADGNDVLAVRKAMEKALELARKGLPNVIEYKTLRLTDHFIGQGGKFRQDLDKVKEYSETRDCLKRFETYLIENNVTDQTAMDALKAQIAAEYEGMVERTKESPAASFEDIFTMENIYATPETGGPI
ncbi:putative Acetoin:2,6-dichlorophenolindophenol oxidoreductase subunit alpha [uncultured delta proteobacterium]|uniref:Putative Acetoin:2,6-dichlorophenolindophenol oxidoreductase subunit alpha n=1 Tax=uncultured delta proteobacterium TaxID=34034 RepID=A0A212JY24_9DELT|nr:putative Acetoin:2,6-dichlorophenolindophenol oxidoreductase subunit alpha [uncultured delta proteobacterium]